MRIGVVADDVTGACDVASALRNAGLDVGLSMGVPTGPLPRREAFVVALTTRMAPVTDAVRDSVAAAQALRRAGFDLLYQKYCSTFDCTDAGNIGPVAEALCELAGPGSRSIGTPATPAVGRTQYRGHLFVGDLLLERSPMRHHPLTPMTDSDLVAVLGRQLQGPVGLVRLGVDDGWAGTEEARHLLVDAITDDDLDRRAAEALDRCGSWPHTVYGGGAGFAAALARTITAGASTASSGPDPVAAGRMLILAGSCSARTLEQIDAFTGPTLRLRTEQIDRGLDGELWAEIDGLWRTAPDGPVLVATSATPDELARQSAADRDRLAAAAEHLLAGVAEAAVAEHGVRALLVAGGETAGAVVARLDRRLLEVGADAATGVPWTVTASDDTASDDTDGRDRLALLLKSGNFGGPELFHSAWASAPIAAD